MSALRLLTAMFDVDTSGAETNLKRLDAGITNAKATLGTIASSVVGAFSVAAIKHFVDEQIELGSKLNDTAEKLGVGTEELQKFQFAAGLSGVEAEGAAQALGFLNKNIGEAIDGGKEQAEVFRKLGVTLKDAQGVRELGDLLPEIADAFEKMASPQERTATAMKIFGKSGAALIPLLKDGGKNLSQLSAEFERLGGGLDDDFIKKADEAGDEIDKLKFAVTGLKSRIAIAVLPTVTEFAKKFQNVIVFARQLTKDTHIVKEGLAALGIVGAAAGIKVAAGWAQFFGLVPKGGSIWKTLLNMGELALIVAGVVLLALAFEDFFTFLRGGQSIIGDVITQFLGFETAKSLISELTGVWKFLSGLFAADIASVKPLIDLFKDLGAQVLPYVVAKFVDIVRVIGGAVAILGAFIKGIAQLSMLDFEGVKKTISATGDLFKKGGILGSSAVMDVSQHAAAVAGATVDTPARLHGSARFGDVNQQNDIRVTVQGGATNAETGRSVANGVRDGLSQAALQQAAAAVPGGGD